MTPSSMYQRSAKPPFFCNACCGLSASASFSGPPSWKLAVSCTLAAWSACNHCGSEGSSTPIHGMLPAACCAATSTRVSAATIPGARLLSLLCTTILRHWRDPSCSTRDKFRCFHAAAAMCVERNRDAATPRALPSTRSSRNNFSRRP